MGCGLKSLLDADSGSSFAPKSAVGTYPVYRTPHRIASPLVSMVMVSSVHSGVDARYFSAILRVYELGELVRGGFNFFSKVYLYYSAF